MVFLYDIGTPSLHEGTTAHARNVVKNCFPLLSQLGHHSHSLHSTTHRLMSHPHEQSCDHVHQY